MKCPKNYTWSAILVASLSTVGYVFLFLWLKADQQSWALIILNILYALIVMATVAYDRKGGFKTSYNSRLVTLGTALSPIAAGIIDALLTMMYSYPNEKWPHVIYFLFIAGGIWIFLSLCTLLVPAKKAGSDTTTSQ